MRLIDKDEVENIFAFTCYNCSCNFLIESVSDTYTIDTGYRHYEDGIELTKWRKEREEN